MLIFIVLHSVLVIMWLGQQNHLICKNLFLRSQNGHRLLTLAGPWDLPYEYLSKDKGHSSTVTKNVRPLWSQRDQTWKAKLSIYHLITFPTLGLLALGRDQKNEIVDTNGLFFHLFLGCPGTLDVSRPNCPAAGQVALLENHEIPGPTHEIWCCYRAITSYIWIKVTARDLAEMFSFHKWTAVYRYLISSFLKCGVGNCAA